MWPPRADQRNAEKSKCPIGFDFEKALGQRAKPYRRQPTIEDENAGQSIDILTKIRDDLRQSILNKRVAAADRIEPINVRCCLFRPRHHVQADAAHDRSRRREAVFERIVAHWIPGFGVKGRTP